jgi:hypothetical protein
MKGHKQGDFLTTLAQYNSITRKDIKRNNTKQEVYTPWKGAGKKLMKLRRGRMAVKSMKKEKNKERCLT